MSPLEITLLLHIYACRDSALPFPESPVKAEALAQFLGDGLVEMFMPDPGEHPYRITERGRAYVDALTNMPLPVAVWTIPGFETRVRTERNAQLTQPARVTDPAASPPGRADPK